MVLVVGRKASPRNETAFRSPISDIASPGIVEPMVADVDGSAIGVAQVPRVGEVSKTVLTKRAGVLAPVSVEIVDMALRAALAL
jgi:hypothetical protein